MAVRVKGGSDVKSGGVIIFHGGHAGFDDVAGLPELGALIHVLIKPLLTHRQLKFLDKED